MIKSEGISSIYEEIRADFRLNSNNFTTIILCFIYLTIYLYF